MKKIVMTVILIVDVVVDFFVVYFTAMQTRTVDTSINGKWGSIYRGTTYFAIYPEKCIPWYITMGLLTIILVSGYVVMLAKTEKNEPFQSEVNRLFCSKCGKQILPDSAFCPYCGANIRQQS